MKAFKKSIAISKKILVQSGDTIIEVPLETVKSMLADIGYSGKLLMYATLNVFKEAKKLTKRGVVHAVDFEKAVVKAVNNTNDIATGTTKKVARRLLK